MDKIFATRDILFGSIGGEDVVYVRENIIQASNNKWRSANLT